VVSPLGLQWSTTESALGFPGVNARYKPDEHPPLPQLGPVQPAVGASSEHWMKEWSKEEVIEATKHVMLTWGPSQPAQSLPQVTHAEGVYIYDAEGKRYLDWTSQAVCNNFGYDVPDQVLQAVQRQMETLPFLYSGMGMVPVRARLSKLLAEICPGDINSFLFPSGGGEANECAIRMARRYTGRPKIMTQYRSYHGGQANSLAATGDFRRAFAESGVTGFVKIFNPQPLGFSWGESDDEATRLCLQVLEEQILHEGPGSIAAIMLETIVGANGVLVPPVRYMQGVRALCDKYDILLILDEVMVGFGRTGEVFAFQHFDGVLPDILTSAKGLTAGFLPMAMVGVRDKIKQFFMQQPLGWGSTYHAHPVAMACAYECLKFMLQEELPQRVKSLQPVMMQQIQCLVDRHPSVKQGRAIGLMGCLDLQGLDGRAIQASGAPSPPSVMAFRQAMRDNGLFGLFRPPLLHCCPPLVITEEELLDGFERLSQSLTVLDAAIQESSAW
jgi:adenosylmethionine-8-amino-7-oxononanoate aminotransferase